MDQQSAQRQYNVRDLSTSSAVQSAAQADPTAMAVVDEIETLAQKVQASPMPEVLKDRLTKMIDRLRRMAKLGSYSGEFELIDRYVTWILSVPWGQVSQDKIELAEAKQIMDTNHYGMDSVKNLVLDYLAVMKLHMDKGGADLQGGTTASTQGETGVAGEAGVTGMAGMTGMSQLQGPSGHAPIICFVGLQGVGKTTMAKSIANALGRQFVRISLGALGGVSQLRGQSRAFLDAEPGQIVKALVRTGTMNPVILLDEIDKVSGKEGILADVMAALLEILDPEQNPTFMDHYIDFPIDLSNVMFICTANNLGTLSAALLDRLEVIRFTSYTDEEKVVIAKKHLLPRVLEATALQPEQIEIAENVWPMITRPLGFDAGIRQLERNLQSLSRRVAREIVEGQVQKVVITTDNIKQYLPEGIGTLS